MSKFFVVSEQIKDDLIDIVGEDVKHIACVLRLQQEDEILVCNKDKGITYQAKIMDILKEKVVCQIENEIKTTNESKKVDVTIFQGLPKADKMEYIIQKATELGVNTIVPVSMKRCIVKLDGKDSIKKIERWQKIAEGAAKQSQRDRIPKVEKIQNLKTMKEMISDFDLFLVAYEEEKTHSIKSKLLDLHIKRGADEIELISKMKLGDKSENFKIREKLKIGVMIGPEGGLEQEEVNELSQYGAKVVSLGNRILRTETASLVVLSNIMYEFEH